MAEKASCSERGLEKLDEVCNRQQYRIQGAISTSAIIKHKGGDHDDVEAMDSA